mgnify:CR=1 FL=1
MWGFGAEAVARAASAGDDYEIAFTAPPSVRAALLEAALAAGVLVHEVGRVETGAGVVLLDERGTPVPVERSGYTHF